LFIQSAKANAEHTLVCFI